jgi:hypothetical protein
MRDAYRRVATTAALALLGLVGTAAVAFVLLPVTGSLQAPVYRAVYPALGPTDATFAATLAQFVVVTAVAASAPALVAHHLAGGTVDARAVAAALGVALLAVVAAAALLLTGLVPVEAGFVLAVAAFVAVAVVLRFRFGVRSGGVTALVGATPAVVLLLALAGFGLGWGWGYVVSAEAVPDSAVNGTAVADFDEVPDVRDDLFAADACEQRSEGRVCRLHLRGYEHERRAARFLARHGVRCPLANGGGSFEAATFVAEHDGTLYRVGCHAHGD